MFFITLVSFLVKIVFVFSSEHSPVVAKVRGLELAQFERLGRSFHRHQRPVRLENLSGIFEPHHLTIEYIVKAAGFSRQHSRGEREFPFPVIPGNTSLKFPVPSLPVAF